MLDLKGIIIKICSLIEKCHELNLNYLEVKENVVKKFISIHYLFKTIFPFSENMIVPLKSLTISCNCCKLTGLITSIGYCPVS